MAGLVRNKKLFTPKWVAGLQGFAKSGMAGKIRIYTSTVTYKGYVPTEVKTANYDGEARIQPILAPSSREVPGDDSKVQRVRFQIPAKDIGIVLLPEVHKVEVYECELNPTLVQYDYRMYEVMDSSNPFEKTFVCEVVTGLVETPVQNEGP